MKTEAELIADINAIVTNYVPNFTTTVVSRRTATVSSLDITIAVIFQDESITTEMLSELVNYVEQNDRNN